MNALHGHFKPEFLNRVDDIIVFRPLGKEQLVTNYRASTRRPRRLLADRKISLELTDAAKELLFTEGFDPNFGARPLKRAIQKLGAGSARPENTGWRGFARRSRGRGR